MKEEQQRENNYLHKIKLFTKMGRKVQIYILKTRKL